jgi:histidine triad (HIT) family protein
MKKHPVLDALQKASKGLVFMSEEDAKLEPFLWKDGGDVTKENVLQHAGSEDETPVEEMTLDTFFRAVPQEDRPKFEKLVKLLREQLSGTKVYKLGDEPEKPVFVVGKTTDGKLAGVKTTVVET